MILRVSVVIPCFDNPRTISQVLKDVVLKTPFPILVVDDGSETPVLNVLYSFEVKQALEQGRLRVVRFEKNRGKGAALRYAIHDLVSRGFTHMVTLDGDGRHLAREIPKLVEQACRHPWDLILGNRGLKTEPPGRFTRWARQIMNYCVRFETGSRLQDSRSGFRLYPLFPLQAMRFRTCRYDWELEVLIRLMWNGVKVREIDVATAEYDPGEHVLHYNRFWDSLRLSLLNLVLLSVALLRTHATPFELGMSMGVGVFVGCMPVFGFHTFIMIALAILFPLNFVAMWIGNHVSTPVLFPFLVMAEVYIGQHWLGISTGEGMMGHVYQWAAGSVVLGVLLSVPSAVLTGLIARAVQRQETDLDQSQSVLRSFVKRAGWKTGSLLVPAIALWRYLWLFRARRGLNQFYRILMPQLSFGKRQSQVLHHMRRCAQIQVDGWARRPGLRAKQIGTPVDSAAVVSAHLGCWEVAGSGLKSPARVFYPDRSIENRFELIPFLGRLAPFDVSPFRYAVRTQTPLVFSFGIKADGQNYELHSAPPRHYQFNSDFPEQLQVVEWMERFVRQLEFYVRKHPDQWLNLYPFWSTLPAQQGPEPGVCIESLRVSLRRERPQPLDLI